jgi:toxin CptA
MVRGALKPSRSLAVVFAGAHLVAAFSAVVLELPLPAKAGVVLAVATSLYRSLRRYAWLRGAASIVFFELPRAESIVVRRHDGRCSSGRVLGTTLVTPVLTVINVRLQASRFAQHVLLVPDNLDAEDFRAVRILLKWGRGKADASSF